MFTILKEHELFLVVNKDPEIEFHRGVHQEGFVERLRAYTGLSELYPIHRLDRMTSGLLVFAKNRDAAGGLSYLFRNRLVDKYYLAVSDRRPKKKQGLIIGDMKKTRRGAWKLIRTRNNPAVTQFFSYPLGSGSRLYMLRPRTGKSHQLRVALKSIGAPIVGDPLYHRKGDMNEIPDRGYLHSYALVFELDGQKHRFVSKPDTGRYFTDETFNQTIKKCESPWQLVWPAVKFNITPHQ